jgi:hypothetical protein
MLTTEQLQKISLLTDIVLYPEAVAFIRQLVKEEDSDPLPSSQANGLLNVAAFSKYGELYTFVVHQRDRNWPPSRDDIKKFYTALEKYLTGLQKRRLKDELHLVTDGLNSSGARLESEELMAALVNDFIQHLVAENGLLAAEIADNKKARRR